MVQIKAESCDKLLNYYIKFLLNLDGKEHGASYMDENKMFLFFVCLFVYFFFILGPYSEENLSIPLFFHMEEQRDPYLT